MTAFPPVRVTRRDVLLAAGALGATTALSAAPASMSERLAERVLVVFRGNPQCLDGRLADAILRLAPASRGGRVLAVGPGVLRRGDTRLDIVEVEPRALDLLPAEALAALAAGPGRIRIAAAPALREQDGRDRISPDALRNLGLLMESLRISLAFAWGVWHEDREADLDGYPAFASRIEMRDR